MEKTRRYSHLPDGSKVLYRDGKPPLLILPRPNPLLHKYQMQKGHAKFRGVKFKLSFEEWLEIWEKSGHLDQRGRKAGTYMMVRVNDRKAYQVGNVKIVLRGEYGVKAPRDQ